MIPVEGHPHLFRDENSGAIINCDESSYYQYVNTVRFKMSQKKEIENLKQEVSEIKSLIQELLNETRKH